MALVDPGGIRWVSATKEAREAIKWLATGIGAASAIALGAGPILNTTKLNLSGWTWLHFVGYFGGAAMGAGGVVSVIWYLLTALVPEELTLADLPAEFTATIRQSRGADLPGDITDLADLGKHLLAYRIASSKLAQLAANESDPVRKQRLRAAADDSKQNYLICRAARDDVLEQGAYFVTRDKVHRLLWPVILGAILTIVGVAIYAIPTNAPARSSTTSTANLATLVKTTNPASDQLWQALGLGSCETTPGHVPVLVTGGNGTADNPYALQTLPTGSACPVVSFTVISDVAQVVTTQPAKITITYTPAGR